MKRSLLPVILLAVLFAACASPAYLQKGVHDGIDVSYRWKHPRTGPSELLMKLTNTTGEDLRIDLGIDLSYQGRTVETLSADTCIRAGQTLNGRLNGIYFIPERLTTEQIKDGGTQVELSRTDVGSCDRP